MEKEVCEATERKNLEIVFFVRDGQCGVSSFIHKAVSNIPGQKLYDCYEIAEELIKDEYFKKEDLDDLACECQRAIDVTGREIESMKTGEPFSISELGW